MNHIDVVLIFPKSSWDIVNVTTRLPLALLYIASNLEHHHIHTKIIDQRVDPEWEGNLAAALADKPHWVGISSMTGQQILWGLKAARLVRQADPSIPIVWGGCHPGILPEQTLEHPLVDVVVVGEGEEISLALTKAFSEQGAAADLSTIPGLYYTDAGNQPVSTGKASIVDLDELPPLDYGLIETRHYILPEIRDTRSLQIQSSRGCPMRCHYCYLGTLANRIL